MNAVVHQVKGLTFLGKSESNHWVTVDGPVEFGGEEAGPRPMELFLIGLAGCTGADVVSILQKKRVRVDGFSIDVKAERKEEHPKVFTAIHLEYLFTGNNISPKDVERAISLSQEKYCPASTMLRAAVVLTYSYRIIEPGEARE